MKPGLRHTKLLCPVSAWVSKILKLEKFEKLESNGFDENNKPLKKMHSYFFSYVPKKIVYLLGKLILKYKQVWAPQNGFTKGKLFFQKYLLFYFLCKSLKYVTLNDNWYFYIIINKN